MILYEFKLWITQKAWLLSLELIYKIEDLSHGTVFVCVTEFCIGLNYILDEEHNG